MAHRFQIIVLFVLSVVPSVTADEQETLSPLGLDSIEWTLVPKLSDEFDSERLDKAKWGNDPSDWGVWSWEPHNAFQRAGVLHIRTEYAPHRRNGVELYYKSGIVKSYATHRYGFAEARIKGASRFPGVCPAFWMHGERAGVSSEVDFMEIQEVQGSIRQIDCNLHARAIVDGELQWIRERRHWIAPWDPRDDFHVFGCRTTEKTISWYIDGRQILSAPNKHWHLPMHIMLSMGLRTPLRIHKRKHGEGNTTLPNPSASSPEGFPTEMLVDYVRIWRPNPIENDVNNLGSTLETSVERLVESDLQAQEAVASDR